MKTLQHNFYFFVMSALMLLLLLSSNNASAQQDTVRWRLYVHVTQPSDSTFGPYTGTTLEGQTYTVLQVPMPPPFQACSSLPSALQGMTMTIEDGAIHENITVDVTIDQINADSCKFDTRNLDIQKLWLFITYKVTPQGQGSPVVGDYNFDNEKGLVLHVPFSQNFHDFVTDHLGIPQLTWDRARGLVVAFFAVGGWTGNGIDLISYQAGIGGHADVRLHHLSEVGGMSFDELGPNSQCIFSGTLRINGVVPADTPTVQLLRHDLSYVRDCIYNPDSGTYGVSAFRSDGFIDSDGVAFRIIRGSDSIIAHTGGDAALFVGTILPSPPSGASLRRIYLTNNRVPSTFDLSLPADNDTLRYTVNRFTWHASSDSDYDALTYSFRLWLVRGAPPELPDTIISGLTDTSSQINLSSILTTYHEYVWDVIVTDGYGVVHSSESFHFYTGSTILGVDISRNPTIPKEFSLSQNYPNPFNPTTDFRIRIVDFGFVSLKVFDELGREVATLVNQNLFPGEYTVKWNALEIPSGVYYYRLTQGKSVSVKKMLLLK